MRTHKISVKGELKEVYDKILLKYKKRTVDLSPQPPLSDTPLPEPRNCNPEVTPGVNNFFKNKDYSPESDKIHPKVQGQE